MLQAEEDRNESIAAAAANDQRRSLPHSGAGGRGEQRLGVPSGVLVGGQLNLGGSAHKKPNAIIAKLISHR